MKDTFLTKFGVTSTDAWEYEGGRPTSGLVAWAQAHVVIAFAGAAFAWFAVVFLITLVLDYVV